MLLETGNLTEEWHQRLSQDPTQLPAFIRFKIEQHYS